MGPREPGPPGRHRWDMADPGGLRAQGAITLSQRGGWRPGWLTLDRVALTFGAPGARGTVRIAVTAIRAVTVERRAFALSARRVIRLTCSTARTRAPGTCWLATADVDAWAEALRSLLGAPGEQARLPGLIAAPGELAGAIAALADPARQALDYLARRGYAATAELMALTGVDTEEALPRYLREQFGAVDTILGDTSIRCLGAHVDQRAGEVRPQCWHLNEIVAGFWLAVSDPGDVLVEDDEVLVIANLPTHERGTVPAVAVASDGRGLTVHGARGCWRWIALPEEVTVAEPACRVSDTGALIVRALRRAPGPADGGVLARTRRLPAAGAACRRVPPRPRNW